MKQLLMIFSSSENSDRHLSPVLSGFNNTEMDVFVFYDGFIPVSEFHNAGVYKAYLQIGVDKTEKVMNAFLKAFLKQYDSILMIDLTDAVFSFEDISRCFDLLRQGGPVVIGKPNTEELSAIGLRRFIPELFENQLCRSYAQKVLNRECLLFNEWILESKSQWSLFNN